ncbi:MAG: hypothetical protein OXR82_15890 [Gammaproteobacteria bacterium]|nr:hypothetical protein [Gammaproteobacteria bacterium]MDE0259852.1 hypothetical protein [Gammaproteobacteria bacterium]
MSKSLKDKLGLSPLEVEVAAVKASLDLIDDMVNNETMTFSIAPYGSEIRFNTPTHHAYFSILLADFFSIPREFFGGSDNYLGLLRLVCHQPLLSDSIEPLSSAVANFDQWLGEEVTIEQRWFPSLDLTIDLKIKRRDFITSCGNICKHNYTQLTRQGKKFGEILEKNGVQVDIEKCMIALPEFYDHFFDDILVYHASTIAQHLNDVRWGIYEYASARRREYVETWWDENPRIARYRYRFPSGIKSQLGKHLFWDLMDDVRREPYIPRFVVTKYLQRRY